MQRHEADQSFSRLPEPIVAEGTAAAVAAAAPAVITQTVMMMQSCPVCPTLAAVGQSHHLDRGHR